MNKREAYILSDEIINILIKERIRQNIKYCRMAVDLNMSKSSIANIENFSQKPTIPTFLIIADYLGLTLEEIAKRLKENK